MRRKNITNFFFTIFKQNCTIEYSGNNPINNKETQGNICSIILETIFNLEKIRKLGTMPIPKRNAEYQKLEALCSEQIDNLDIGVNFKLNRFDYRQHLQQILSYIEEDQELRTWFKATLNKTIEQILALNDFYLLFRRRMGSKLDSSTQE